MSKLGHASQNTLDFGGVFLFKNVKNDRGTWLSIITNGSTGLFNVVSLMVCFYMWRKQITWCACLCSTCTVPANFPGSSDTALLWDTLIFNHIFIFKIFSIIRLERKLSPKELYKHCFYKPKLRG